VARRRKLPDTLRSAELKLKRANLHAQTTRREAKRFMDAQSAPSIDGRFEDNYSRYVIYVVKDFPDPPESFSPRFGDAIHNYRCVLDHIAWQLVRAGTSPNPKRPDRVQFPIYSTAKRFRRERAGRLPGVGRGPVDFIESRQPYPGRKAAEYPLGTLAKLSNDDKHRSIHTVVAGLAAAEITFDCTDCLVSGHFGAELAPILKAGTPIAGMIIERTGPNPKMDVDLGLGGYIALEDRRDALIILDQIKTEVTKILNAPEIITAV
jgi:hypothetical protein